MRLAFKQKYRQIQNAKKNKYQIINNNHLGILWSPTGLPISEHPPKRYLRISAKGETSPALAGGHPWASPGFSLPAGRQVRRRINFISDQP